MQQLLIDTIRIDSLKNMYQPYNVEVDILRLDEIHPVISGNKWFKLKEYLLEAEREGEKNILTFGGAWSNHILATAAACNLTNFNSIGIIRGEKAQNLSATLEDVLKLKMKLFFTERSSYAQKKVPEEVWHQYKQEETYIIPEGGYGLAGCSGAYDIGNYYSKKYSHVITACGTGTTFAGLVKAATNNEKLIGISVLKNHLGLTTDINQLLPLYLQNQFTIMNDFHFGGYAKITKELISFMNSYYLQTSIPTDIVYTGKMFYAVDQLIKINHLPANSQILIIHTGGLQGNRSLPKGTLIF